MDLEFSSEEDAFRDEVKAFLKEKLTKRLSDKVKAGQRLTKEDYEEWHAVLNEQGWLAPSWPEEYGGTNWSAIDKHIAEEEFALAGAPRTVPFGVNMLAPVLLKFGSDAQKAHYLPRILDGTDWWCQGYSEPGAGSDLASLKTKAERDGDHYIVNGQKTWTTLGQYADWIFCLVRTSSEGKKQEGISFLLIDMKSEGISVRPIVLLEGEHEVNEVFFDNVKVPASNLVGEENMGWTYAKYLLTHERTGIAGVGFATAGLEKLKSIARRQMKRGKPLIEDPLFSARIAEAEIDLDAMRTTNLRVLADATGGAAGGMESSMLKVKGTVLRQNLNALTRQALGPYALPFVSEALEEGYNEPPIGPDYAAPITKQYFNNRKTSIYGGSNEVQKSIIAKLSLGR
ncbi:MAG: acyl-CoA dehydrogenase family protein [Hyphomicrobiales bacterium]